MATPLVVDPSQVSSITVDPSQVSPATPGPGVPNPLQANPSKYTPAGLRPGDKPLPSTTVGAEALRNLPGALVRYASLGMTQPDTIGPQGIVNPVTGIMDAASDIYHTFRHPLESFAQDPVATVNTPAMIWAGGKGAREAVNATGVGPVVSTAAKGAREGITAELPQIKNWSKWGAIAGLPLGMGTGDIATRVLGASEGGGIGGAVGGGARAIPAAVRGARGALARRAATKWTPTTEGYMPTIGQGASPRPPNEPPPPPSGPPRGPDWWEAYQQELRSQPPPQEPYYPPPPEPTYIEPPPPPAAVAAPVGPRLPEGWEPTIPDYMKPGAETAEQMAARHEAEGAAAANTSQARTMSGDDIISMDLHGKPYAKLTPGQRDDVALYKKIIPQTVSQPPAAVAPSPSLDRLTAQVTGGANKKFAQASEAVKKEVQASAPPVVAPPPGMAGNPIGAGASAQSEPLGGTALTEREIRGLNQRRANTGQKNYATAQYFLDTEKLTPEQVAALSESEYATHARKVISPATGKAYEQPRGRNEFRSHPETIQDVVEEMRKILADRTAAPIAPPPPPQ